MRAPVAERARAELLATGERVRKRTVETRDELTPQEHQIAGLARDGLSNPQIGARLFLSPRTVEWHRRKVFAKLEIHSRRELAIRAAGVRPRTGPAPRRGPYDVCVTSDGLAPLSRASIARTAFSNALSNRPLPTVPSTSPTKRPLKFLPSRTTT